MAVPAGVARGWLIETRSRRRDCRVSFHRDSYVIQPTGPFASEIYRRMAEILDEQLSEGVEMMTSPGVIAGHVPRSSGATLPIVIPSLRSMFTWTTEALVDAFSRDPTKRGKSSDKPDAAVTATMRTVIARILNDYVNLGVRSEDRALNFAITDGSRLGRVVRAASSEGLALERVSAEASPVTRPERRLVDVVWIFVDPKTDSPLKEYFRCTFDVTDISPVPVGDVTRWSAP